MTESPTGKSPTLVWFRNDLRVADNPALSKAVERGAPVICVYIIADDRTAEAAGMRPMGGASRWWLAGSLRSLKADLEALGAGLSVLRGDAAELIPEIVKVTDAAAVYWNRRYSKAESAIDSAIEAGLRADGIAAESFNAHLLNEPWDITSKTGGPLKVFTPYWRAVRAKGAPSAPLPPPKAIKPYNGPMPRPVAIDQAGLEPVKPDWASGLRAEWTPGEAGAKARLRHFIDEGLAGYDAGRNRPDLPKTSRLSPHLKFGEISVRQCWYAAEQACSSGQSNASATDLETFLKELVWREFSYHLLHHNPALATTNYAARFDGFPWQDDPAALKAWQRGQTGYPIVDAGMRQLYATGWMHNRVRMIAGSLLVKHLLTDWRRGEEWFWDTLVDADPASNAASWQWVAGSGADAAPYFRIFNPMLQGEKFDPDGAYVRQWVPELAELPSSVIHQPWTAPALILKAAGVELGHNYPKPIVAHEVARERALSAFKSLRELTEA